jgi:hypothetical protein
MKLVFGKHRDILIKNLGMQRLAANFVPCLLMEKQNKPPSSRSTSF